MRVLTQVSSLRAKGKGLWRVERLFAKQSHRVRLGIASCLVKTVRSGLWLAGLGYDAAFGLRALTRISSLRAKENTLCWLKTRFAKQSHRVRLGIASCLAMTEAEWVVVG
ncbi:MAG: hypothetical protein JSS98_10520 [Bacteroidetes bacterium]|nr:hypothetical protein [Bacteroidota bacterium]